MKCIVTDVERAWKTLTRRERCWLVSEAATARDAGWRTRCQIVRNLARGQSPTRIVEVLGCSRSQVYRVAERFLAEGPAGLVDRREANGPLKATEKYAATVLMLVESSPEPYGYQRPTWTQELLILVAHEQTGVWVSTTTMSRLLARHGARRGRPKPVVDCPRPADDRHLMGNPSSLLVSQPLPTATPQERAETPPLRKRELADPVVDRLVRKLPATVVGKVPLRAPGDLVRRPAPRQTAPHMLVRLGALQLAHQRPLPPALLRQALRDHGRILPGLRVPPQLAADRRGVAAQPAGDLGLAVAGEVHLG
jgi:transposase